MDSLFLTGTVRFFLPAKGFGFIDTDDGSEIFIGAQNLAKTGLRKLEKGVRVSFVTFRGRRGSLEATEVRVLGDE
jgi:cold shock protein